MIIVRVVYQTVFLALGQIWANKTRSLLTALGIIISVAAVLAVVAALGGMRKNVLSEFETFGAKKFFVNGYVPRDLRGVVSWTSVKLSQSEAERILEKCTAVDTLTIVTDNRYEVRNGDVLETGVEVTGIWPAWHEIEDRYTLMGRPFTTIDEDEARQVCLVNDKAIEELGLDLDPTGDFLIVNNRRFLIVGVVETKEVGPMFGGGDSQSEIFVPFATSKKLNPYSWNWIIGQVSSPDQAEEARQQIRFALRNMRNLAPDDEDTFRVEVLQQFIDQFDSLATGITMVAAGVVSISLLVGGVGIMNIMLVSVSERTREIGLRKAVGARPAIILLQFLTEAVVLCIVGGLIGLVIGQALTLALQNIPNSGLEEASIPPAAIVLAFGFSASVGVIFGMFPAIKASRLDPIEALRHE